MRIFGKNKLYLKNAGVIESLAKINTIVLDKTGTITQNKSSAVIYEGTPLTSEGTYSSKKYCQPISASTKQNHCVDSAAATGCGSS